MLPHPPDPTTSKAYNFNCNAIHAAFEAVVKTHTTFLNFDFQPLLLKPTESLMNAFSEENGANEEETDEF